MEGCKKKTNPIHTTFLCMDCVCERVSGFGECSRGKARRDEWGSSQRGWQMPVERKSWTGGKASGSLSMLVVVIRALSPASCGILSKSIVSHCGHLLWKGAGRVTSAHLSSSENFRVLKHLTGYHWVTHFFFPPSFTILCNVYTLCGLFWSYWLQAARLKASPFGQEAPVFFNVISSFG